MSVILIAGPRHEPVTVADLREHLRLDTSDDALLMSLISAARLTVEAQSGLKLINQHWRMLSDTWPSEYLALPLRPVNHIKSIGLTGSRKTLPDTAYDLQQAGSVSTLIMSAVDLPRPQQKRFGVQIDMTAGFGSEPDAVPADLRLAVMTLAAHWYDLEDWNQFQGRHAVPPNIATLIDNHRMPHL